MHGPEKYRIGFIGAPLAVVIAYHCIFLCNLIYALLATPKAAWCGFSKDIFRDLGVNYRLGGAGVLALCSEWWGEYKSTFLQQADHLHFHLVAVLAFSAFEALGLGSTYLGQVTQATTAIYTSVMASLFPLPYALSLAAAIRIGHLVGAGNAEGARLASSASSKLAMMLAVFAVSCIVLLRRQIAALYTDNEAVLHLFSNNVSIDWLLIYECDLHVYRMKGAGSAGCSARRSNADCQWWNSSR